MKKFSFISVLLLTIQILSGQWVARHNMTATTYQQEFNTWIGQGYRLTQISGYYSGGQDRFAAIWKKVTNSPAWQAKHGLNATEYQAIFNQLTSQGFRPVQVSVYPSGSTARYAAIFDKPNNTPSWVARHNLNAAKYQEEFDTWTSQGYYPVDIGAATVNGQSVHTVIFEKPANKPAWEARHNLSASQYQAEFDKWANQGYRLKKVCGYEINNQPAYAAIWEKSGSGYWFSYTGLNTQAYQDQFERMYYTGYYPVWVNGYTVNGNGFHTGIWESQNGFNLSELNAVDNLIKTFMQTYKVPGLSFAISKDDRLVLAKTYGYADKEAGEMAAPRHRFRIASLSKPITATAIMKLSEQNSIKLSNKVFGSGSILGTTYGTQPYKKYVTAITVQHLLEHLGGGWKNDANDPMFKNATMNHSQLITWTLDNQALINAPGTQYAYSNFGYCVLGRIIEKKTGNTYESWIKNNIFNSCGITGMEIGGNTLAERKSNEVKYYGQNGEDPYCCNVKRMDSHGGWIATSIDLVRFLVRVNKFSQKPDILQQTILTNMFTASSVNPSYAKGWSVNSSNNYWHNGSLPGEQSIMVRTSSGYTWAILVNTRSNNIGGAMDGLMWNVVGAIKTWPSFDLF